MADNVEVDTDMMSGVLPRLTSLADRTKGAHDGAVERLASFNGAAGTDDAGAKAFYASYNPAVQQVIGAMLDFCAISDGIVTGIHTMIRGYITTESNNTVPGFGGDNGGGDHNPPPTEKPPTEKP